MMIALENCNEANGFTRSCIFVILNNLEFFEMDLGESAHTTSTEHSFAVVGNINGRHEGFSREAGVVTDFPRGRHLPID